MTSPTTQNKVPETDQTVISMGNSHREFKIAVLRKLNEFEENRDMFQYSNTKT